MPERSGSYSPDPRDHVDACAPELAFITETRMAHQGRSRCTFTQ